MKREALIAHFQAIIAEAQHAINEIHAEAPAELQSELAVDADDELAKVMRVLAYVAAQKNAPRPKRPAIAKVMEAFPNRDAVKVAQELEFWHLHGNGARKGLSSVAGRFRTFMEKADPVPVSKDTSAYDRTAN